MPYTCECGHPFDLIAALDALPLDHMGSSGMLCPACGGCGKQMEIRLGNGSFTVGYSYFGGSMHFEPVKRVRLAGLNIVPSDPDDLEVTVGKRRWQFRIRRPTSSRFSVFPKAFAAGKKVRELDLAQWSVTLTGIKRADSLLPVDPETVIEPGDVLHCSGSGPGLDRAWNYINHGMKKR